MPHLYGQRIILREYRESDFEHVRRWVNDSEATANLSSIFDRVQTEAMTRSFFNKPLNNELPGHYFVIADREDESYIGQIDIRTQDDPSRQASLGLIVPDLANRGRGYGREAIGLILTFAFDTLNLHKVWLHVLARNEGAIGLYRSLGFVTDGVLREDVYRDGVYLDAMIMSILAREWRSCT
ncbi:MAG: GNAT family N-acetyltransferase [Spirochaetales bacterium]|nr:GNAT family N-acetyltransferase [Spirochaetales bacterium]